MWWSRIQKKEFFFFFFFLSLFLPEVFKWGFHIVTELLARLLKKKNGLHVKAAGVCCCHTEARTQAPEPFGRCNKRVLNLQGAGERKAWGHFMLWQRQRETREWRWRDLCPQEKLCHPQTNVHSFLTVTDLPGFLKWVKSDKVAAAASQILFKPFVHHHKVCEITVSFWFSHFFYPLMLFNIF